MTPPPPAPAGAPDEPPRSWLAAVYRSPLAMIAAGYVFPPLGFYLMWRYRSWHPALKAGITVFGSVLAVSLSYLSARYVWPAVL